jgi:hypothetical protein
MARIIYSALITELSGSIAGVTFQNNASGHIVRTKPNNPVNPSYCQQLQLSAVSRLVNIYSTLTIDQKTDWRTLALNHPNVGPFGTIKQLNGYQMFLSCNLNLLTCNQNPILEAPSYSAPTSTPNFEVFSSSLSVFLTLNQPFTYNSHKLFLFASPVLRSVSEQMRRNNFMICDFVVDGNNSFEFSNLYNQKFNVTLLNILAYSHGSIIFRLKLIDFVTGFSSQYSTFILNF